jgi:hypothetical protein
MLSTVSREVRAQYPELVAALPQLHHPSRGRTRYLPWVIAFRWAEPA